MIEFHHVSLSLQNREILRDLSFRVDKGESILLAGSSGAGKSTILKLALGLIKPTSGRIYILGREITRLSEKKLMAMRRYFGTVFQGGALFDSLTVEQNVGFFLRENLKVEETEVRSRVQRTLQFLGLEKFLSYLPSQLSGGMRKRVAIARAIVTNPQALLYDEPTAGLDPIAARRVIELIRHLRERFQVTSLIVSHEIHYFLDIVDRMLMLKDGKIIYDGEPNLDIVEYFDESDGMVSVQHLAG